MGRRIPVPIHIDIPYGQKRHITFYINDVLYENVEDYVVKKYLNSVYTVVGTLFGADKTDTNVATGNIIKIFAGATLIMVGILDKPTWKSHDEVLINGICRVASKLKDVRLSNNIENVTYFDNKTSTYIVDSLCSENNDGSAPWIVTPNNIDNFAKLFVRGDNDSKMGVIINVTNNINYNWYPSYGLTPYNDTILNMEEHKGSQSPVMTLTVSGSSQNVEMTSREEDRDELWNDIIVCGYGDGVNQIKARAWSTTVTKTYLSADINATDTTATVNDGSILSASGLVAIGSEMCIFTRTGNTLTIARDDLSTATGSSLLSKSYAHNAGIGVYQIVGFSSAESGSSIDTYGHKMNTVTDRSIMDQNTLDKIALTMLAEHDEELVRIEVIAMDMFDIIDRVEVGDYVTITETEVGNDGNYRVVGMEIEEYKLKIVCSNSPIDLVTTIVKSETSENSLNYYMQGSTNIYAINESENCDSTKSLNVRFPIPAETIIIDKVLLSFKIKPYRYYTGTTPSGGGSTSGSSSSATTAAGTSHLHSLSGKTTDTNDDSLFDDQTAASGTVNITTSWSTINTHSLNSNDTFGVQCSFIIQNKSGSTEQYEARLWNSNDSTYFPDSSGVWVTNALLDDGCAGHTLGIWDNVNGDDIRLQLKSGTAGGASTVAFINWTQIGKHTHSFTGTTTHSEQVHTHGMTHTHTTPNHTHTMTPVMQEATAPSGNVVVTAGADGSELSVGTIGADVNELDITNHIRDAYTPGTITWMNVKFAPATELMRIEVSAYIQIFINSSE